MLIMRRAPDGIDGRVLDQQEQIVAAVGGSRGAAGDLEIPGCLIRQRRSAHECSRPCGVVLFGCLRA
jgi:hypothetical protein